MEQLARTPVIKYQIVVLSLFEVYYIMWKNLLYYVEEFSVQLDSK